MQAANHLRSVLTQGKVAFGGWQMLSGTNVSRAMARSGIDWICVDCEHGNISDSEMHEAVSAIASVRPLCSPVVRIPATEPWMVKRALDSGAHGIIVPLLRTAAEAKDIVKAAKFPPLGIRGFGSPFAMNTFEAPNGGVPGAAEYLAQANDALLTIVQIETQEALENVDAIAAVDGIDVLLIGPFDLGNNIGHPNVKATWDPELAQAVEKIRLAAKKAGKKSAIYATSGDQSRGFVEQGFDMINVTGDVPALQTHVAAELAKARGGAGAGGAPAMSGPYGR